MNGMAPIQKKIIGNKLIFLRKHEDIKPNMLKNQIHTQLVFKRGIIHHHILISIFIPPPAALGPASNE